MPRLLLELSIPDYRFSYWMMSGVAWIRRTYNFVKVTCLGKMAIFDKQEFQLY